MPLTRKMRKKTVPAKTKVARKGAKRPPAKGAVPSATIPASSDQDLEPSGFLVVGIGASAGGLEAMEEFFRHMPPVSGMAFVVVSHQHAGHVSLLPGLLSRYTAMPVREVKDGMVVEPNTVYLSPGGINLALHQGVLQIMEASSKERVPLPIDYFFRSLAEDQKQQAVGIVLSGTGSDGTVGLRAIKAESGLTIAQEPESSKYQGMPRSAIVAGTVDVVRPSAKMAEPLLAYARTLTRPAPLLPGHEASQTLRKIFILLRDRTGNDFGRYKENTIHRRIERRMNVHQIESLRQYLRYLQTNPSELDALFQELLIGVTGFFRDPQAFELLQQKVLPTLVEGRPEGTTLRVWVAGCSTGEEAYSLAILLREFLTQKKLRLTVQVFASDLDGRAIDRARVGLYPVGIAEDLTPARLQRFFNKEDQGYRVKKEIRDLVVFAVHNLLTDAPFTKLDLLSCRNLLIYLDTQAQHKLLPLFHYALKPNGFLVLGTSETVGEFDPLFTLVDRKWKLFKRTAERTRYPQLERYPAGLMKVTRGVRVEPEAALLPVRAASIPALIQQFLVSLYAPAAVVVNARGEVIYIHGHTGTFLELAPGKPSLHLIEMAREGLQHDLATALHQASGQAGPVERHGLRVATNAGPAVLVNLTVKKIEEPETLQGLFLVTFEAAQEDKPMVRKRASVRAGAAATREAPRVLQELEFTKQRLQRTVEELQTSNEELKSTNEELQSTNEELQSTNEELETAKEEMQSLNEELLTVNAELQAKLDALADAHDDLQNLLNSTEVATIFLDNELHIKRFTSEAKRVSCLSAVDVGRPLSDIVSKLTDTQLLDDAREVLQTLVLKERDVRTADGSWFTMRILPYRTGKNSIDGLVVTFLDVTKLKQAKQAIEAAREFAANIVETMREPLLVLDDQFRVVSANQSFYRTFQVAPREVEQQVFSHLCAGAWNQPDLLDLLADILPKGSSFQDVIVDQTFPHVGRLVLAVSGRQLEQNFLLPGRILLAMGEVRSGSGPNEERDR